MSEKYNIFELFLKDTPKYNKPRELDGIQENVKNIKPINFKQDYCVVIRKKLYYAATAVSQEAYLRVYQVNNFLSIRTSHSVYGKPGTCSISLKGGERVTCANKADQDQKGWEDWKTMLAGWTNIDDEGDTNGNLWRTGDSNWNRPGSEGVDYKSIMKAKEAKYGWKFAEKCDWEPMDEIYVFAKNRDESKRTKTKTNEFIFSPIFFGYINSVTKTYQAGKGGMQINISASDQLKLLQLGKTLNYPSAAPGKFANGGIDIKFDRDEFGCFKINDPFKDMQDGNAPTGSHYVAYQNVFSGKYPFEVITQLARDSGIPEEYLTKRIEPIKMVPFLTQLRNGTTDMFNADFKDRLQTCQKMAEILLCEFFCDEEGNLVFKIPNYALGCNKLPANNMGYKFPDNILDGTVDIIKETNTNNGNGVTSGGNSQQKNNSDNVTVIEYTVKSGDTLMKLAESFLGDKKLYNEIYRNNINIIGNDPNKIKPGMKLKIYKRDINSSSANKNVANQIKNDSLNLNNSLNQGVTSTGLEFIKGKSLCIKTDSLIKPIKPEFIISFNITDTDNEIYNMYEIQAESNYVNLQGFEAIRRAIPDLNSIIRFGLRPHPGVINTPLINSELEAQLFGTLMLNKSLAGRYSGSLTMIEDASIKIGDPIRFLTYDEHPYKETGLFNSREQSVFYVTGIERNISPSNISYMTLQLKYGRMMGQESVCDICYPIYKMYYDEKFYMNIEPSLTVEKYKNSPYETYTVQQQDTIQKIMNRKYGYYLTGNQFNEKLSIICALNPQIFNGKTILNTQTINETLKTGVVLKIPK